MWRLTQNAPVRSTFAIGVRFASVIPIDKIRNFGVSAHVDSGKTTLTERILFYTGKIQKIHEVGGKDGVGAVMDSMKQERERGITIKSAATFSKWRDTYFNIIDTPGHIDFTVEVERSLRVLDGAILVVCGCGGVQSQTLTVDRQMKRYDVPRVVFINKLDRKEAMEVGKTVQEIRSRLGLNAALVQIPVGYGHSAHGHEGLIDVITMKYLTFEGPSGIDVVENDIPEPLMAEAKAARTELIEKLADICDVIGEKYLEEEEPTEEEIHSAIRQGTIDLTFAPVFVGSAKANKGVQPLLDAVSRYLPDPTQVENKGIIVKDGVESSITLSSNAKEDLVAMAFKIDIIGKRPLTYIRVYQGVLKKGDTVRLAPRGSDNWKETKTAKITKLVKMHSSDLEEVDRISSGEIGGAEGLDCASGDTLVNASQKTMVSCESIFVPAPVISLRINPKNPNDTQNLMAKLKRFEKEDPTFHFAVDPETRDLQISGMGELHLEIFVQRLASEEGIVVESGKPFVQYREFLPCEVGEELKFDYRHKKQSGGRGQFAQFNGFMSRVDKPLSSKDTSDKHEIEMDILGVCSSVLKGSERSYVNVVPSPRTIFFFFCVRRATCIVSNF